MSATFSWMLVLTLLSSKRGMSLLSWTSKSKRKLKYNKSVCVCVCACACLCACTCMCVCSNPSYDRGWVLKSISSWLPTINMAIRIAWYINGKVASWYHRYSVWCVRLSILGALCGSHNGAVILCSVIPSWDHSIPDTAPIMQLELPSRYWLGIWHFTSWRWKVIGHFTCVYFYVKCYIPLGNLTLNCYTDVLTHKYHMKEPRALAVSVPTLKRPSWGIQVAFCLIWQKLEQCLPLRCASIFLPRNVVWLVLSADHNCCEAGWHLLPFTQSWDNLLGSSPCPELCGCWRCRKQHLLVLLEHTTHYGQSHQLAWQSQ